MGLPGSETERSPRPVGPEFDNAALEKTGLHEELARLAENNENIGDDTEFEKNSFWVTVNVALTVELSSYDSIKIGDASVRLKLHRYGLHTKFDEISFGYEDGVVFSGSEKPVGTARIESDPLYGALNEPACECIESIVARKRKYLARALAG